MKMISIRLSLLALGALVSFSHVALAEEIWDPLEPMNRGIFWFNDKMDIYIMEPVAKGYDYVVPDPVKTGVGNFFSNLRYPIHLVSDVLQLKFTQAAEHTGRFLINSTVGLGGLFDVAKTVGLEEHDEDLGITFAYYGIPAGPYLVLPFLGPSNLRDGIGRIGNGFLDPAFYIDYTNASTSTKWAITLGTKSLDFIDTRAKLLEAIKAAKESSTDYYLFLQGAYYQYRRGVLYDGNPPDEDEFGQETLPEEVSTGEAPSISQPQAKAVDSPDNELK